MKLNLGCGDDLKDGYVNVDFFNDKCDLKVDLESLPLPFEDSSVDEVLLDNVLEHLWVNPYKFMLEIHRILRKGGLVFVELPMLASQLTHVRWFHRKHYFNNICGYESSIYSQNNSLFLKKCCWTKFMWNFRRFPFFRVHYCWYLVKR